MAVNLLPFRETRRKNSLRQLRRLFICGMILVLIGWSILFAKQVIFLKQQQGEIGRLQQHIQAIAIDYQRYLTADKQRQQQTQIADYLKKALLTDQRLLQLLRELGEKMPPGMYLTQIQKNNQAFGFSGKSTSHAEITLLPQQLENKPQQSHPRLTETRHSDRQNPDIDFDLIYESYAGG